MRALPIVLGLLLISSRPATAQTTLSVTGSPAKMTITTAVAGSQPTSVTNAATTYRVQVNSWRAKKIVAKINPAMPLGTTLQLYMVPPVGVGATSPGPVSLTTVNQDIVNNIANVNPTVTLGITYKFSATAAAGVVSSSRKVTLTMVTGP